MKWEIKYVFAGRDKADVVDAESEQSARLAFDKLHPQRPHSSIAPPVIFSVSPMAHKHTELPESLFVGDATRVLNDPRMTRCRINSGVDEVVANVYGRSFDSAVDIARELVTRYNQHAELIRQRDELLVALEACRNAMLGKVNPANPAWELSSKALTPTKEK